MVTRESAFLPVSLPVAKPRTGHPMNRRSGFSLFELLLVLSLLAALASLTIPAIGSFATRRKRQELKDAVYQSLAQSRLAAIENGRPQAWKPAQWLAPSVCVRSLIGAQKSVRNTHGIRFLPDGTATDAVVDIRGEDEENLGGFQIVGATGAILSAD